jgi:hypothetical protein
MIIQQIVHPGWPWLGSRPDEAHGAFKRKAILERGEGEAFAATDALELPPPSPTLRRCAERQTNSILITFSEVRTMRGRALRESLTRGWAAQTPPGNAQYL